MTATTPRGEQESPREAGRRQASPERERTRASGLLALLALLLAAEPRAFALEESPPGGSVIGTVHYVGTGKPSPTRKNDRDVEACGAEIADGSLLLQDGLLANAVVSLSGVRRGKTLAPTVGAVLDQRGCLFVPRVQAVAVGSKVKLNNGDAALHNVNAQSGGATVFNLGMPTKDLAFNTMPLAKPGLIKVRCEAGHDWMAAFIHVFDHPYFAVTAADGRFALGDVPVGEYTLTVWHERLKKPHTVKVKVTSAGPTELDARVQ